jgi:hypothetical protein
MDVVALDPGALGFFVFVGIWLAMGWLGSLFARDFGAPVVAGWLLGLFLGPIGWGLVALFGKGRTLDPGEIERDERKARRRETRPRRDRLG